MTLLLISIPLMVVALVIATLPLFAAMAAEARRSAAEVVRATVAPVAAGFAATAA